MIKTFIALRHMSDKEFGVEFGDRKKLQTVEEVLEEIAKIKLQPPNKLTSTKYSDNFKYNRLK